MDACKGITKGVLYFSYPLNEYQKPVLRRAEEARGKHSAEVGVLWRWLSDGAFTGEKVWYKGGK